MWMPAQSDQFGLPVLVCPRQKCYLLDQTVHVSVCEGCFRVLHKLVPVQRCSQISEIHPDWLSRLRPHSFSGRSLGPQLFCQLADVGWLGRSPQQLRVYPLRCGGKRWDTEGLEEREGDWRPPLRVQVGGMSTWLFPLGDSESHLTWRNIEI